MLVSVISLVAAIAAVLFAAWQSREVANQTKLANDMAGSSLLTAALEHLHTTLRTLIDYPELRPYFYDGKSLPAEDLATTARVATTAEMLLDVLESSIYGASKVEPFAEHRADWLDYAEHLLDRSPAMVSLLAEHPQWYPELAKWWGNRTPAAPPDPSRDDAVTS